MYAPIDSLDTSPLPRSSQMTGSASAARLARHQLSATTATASGKRTMCRTPFMSLIAVSSTAFNRPLKTGQWTIAA